MEIVSITEITEYVLKVSGNTYTDYRRSSSGFWKVLEGDVWRLVSRDKELELEELFQIYKGMI